VNAPAYDPDREGFRFFTFRDGSRRFFLRIFSFASSGCRFFQWQARRCCAGSERIGIGFAFGKGNPKKPCAECPQDGLLLAVRCPEPSGACLLRWRGVIVQGGMVCAAAVNLRVHLPHENVMHPFLQAFPCQLWIGRVQSQSIDRLQDDLPHLLHGADKEGFGLI
jgi:hypothetical protein